MTTAPKPVAIVCSDLHLCHTPPSCRQESTREAWYGVMERQLRELQHLAETCTHFGHNTIPIIVAGDIFDTWSVPPELINFLIDQFHGDLRLFAIPGQHDLPNHRIDQKHKSAYGTLCRVGLISDLTEPVMLNGNGEYVHVIPFPWGVEIEPYEPAPLVKGTDFVTLAAIHRYAWKEGCSHPQAADADNVKSLVRALRGYDVAVFGDNHIAFDVERRKAGDTHIINCGNFLRRSRPEFTRRPRVGVVWSDKSVVSYPLESVQLDVMVKESEAVLVDREVTVEGIFSESDFEMDGVDFESLLRRQSSSLDDETSAEIRSIILKAKG